MVPPSFRNKKHPMGASCSTHRLPQGPLNKEPAEGHRLSYDYGGIRVSTDAETAFSLARGSRTQSLLKRDPTLRL